MCVCVENTYTQNIYIELSTISFCILLFNTFCIVENLLKACKKIIKAIIYKNTNLSCRSLTVLDRLFAYRIISANNKANEEKFTFK